MTQQKKEDIEWQAESQRDCVFNLHFKKKKQAFKRSLKIKQELLPGFSFCNEADFKERDVCDLTSAQGA